MSESTNNESAPILRIVRGTPDAGELAALVAVLGARSAGGAAAAEPQRGGWNDRSLALRQRLAHGPGAWRRSARTR